MKKSTYLFAFALGASTITFAQNLGVNTDGSDPDANTILHIKNHFESSLDSTLLRIENEKATTGTGVQIENSGTASSKWDIIVPGSSTDLRIKGNGSDHVTIQNDGDVGIGTTTPASTLDLEGSIGLKYNTINTAATLDNTYNVVFCDGGDYTVTLPAATTCEGRVYYIKNIDAEGDDITIDGHGSETIDGSETYVLDCENDVIRILSNGSSWYIIDEANRTCASANAGASLAAICQGETSAAMGGSVGGSATGGTWSGGSGTWTNADDPSAATYTADASESGSINLTLTTSDGTATATKTITVNASNTAGAASSEPTLDVNTPLTDITHTTTGATGIGTATGLPAGVTAAWASNTITISGTPTADGTFNYSIPLTGGCGSVNATGTIIVEASVSYPPGTVHCSGTPTEVVDVTFTYGGQTYTYMDRNLGASGKSTQSRKDFPTTSAGTAAYIAAQEFSFGDLYQWGRAADGHQCRNSSLYNGSSLTRPGSPTASGSWDGKFIYGPTDWLSSAANGAWSSTKTATDPCPIGYRVPTQAELQALDNSFSSQNYDDAFNSPLRLPVAGYRSYSTGSLFHVGTDANYWSSSVSGANAYDLIFNISSAFMATRSRAYGFSVRCIKD